MIRAGSLLVRTPALPRLAFLALVAIGVAASSGCSHTGAPATRTTPSAALEHRLTESRTAEATRAGPVPTVSVRPAPIDAVLYNPGMGFTDSHFAYHYEYPSDRFLSYGDYENPPPYPDPADYPASKVAYFRWCWSDIEPAEGRIDFARFESIIAHGARRSQGERLGFRIVAVNRESCLPTWLTSKPGYRGFDRGLHVPDYSNPVFVAALEQLLGALGRRYDGHPGIDHLDIGVVGCWGEWNTACLAAKQDLCASADLSTDRCLTALERIIDIHINAFPHTPKLMLGKAGGVLGEAMRYALQRGAGWRVDCLGDWGMFGPGWSHHVDVYPAVAQLAGDAWKRAPVHFEICGSFPDWDQTHHLSLERVRQTFDWALAHHASVINGKSTPIPPAYAAIITGFLKKVGYRLVLSELVHGPTARGGQTLTLETRWKNLGVAPPYLPHALAFRLRDARDEVVFQATSRADIRQWLPGDSRVIDRFALPPGLPAGVYALDAALLGPDGATPAITLAIEGRRPDGWYGVSQLAIERSDAPGAR